MQDFTETNIKQFLKHFDITDPIKKALVAF